MVKVIIADNQGVFRVGVARTLVQREEIAVIAQINDGVYLFGCMEKYRNVVVIFASSLRLDLLSLTYHADKNGCKLVVVAENTECLHTYVRKNIAGVIFRNISCSRLVSCIRTVDAGGTYLQQQPGRSLTDESNPVGFGVVERLTRKEIEVVSLVILGYSNKAIAEALKTVEQVIKNYLYKIFDRVGVHNRAELALYIIQHRELAQVPAERNRKDTRTA